MARAIAVLAFFVVAILSFIAGCAPDACCGRAILGGIAAYFVSAWAWRVILNIAYDALTADKRNNNQRVGYVDTDANR
jgi:hypothetical protein